MIQKIGEIENEFRTYDYEFLAGEIRPDDLHTVHTEDDVRFNVDIKKMYWCSKLSTERNRMIGSFLKPGQVLCDMMSGVGPMAIKAAVKV